MTVPRTWFTAELVPASTMNAHVRDMLIALGAAKAVMIGVGDFAGAPLGTGVKAYFEMPFAMRVTGWTLMADAVGSIQLDLWKDTYANFPPTVADTITGSEKPKLVAEQKQRNLVLSTWTSDLNQGDTIAVNVDSTSGVIKQCTLTLRGSLLALL